MGTLLQKLKALWRGQMPLEVAFWHYAIYYGLIVNVVATTIFVVLLLVDAPIALVVAVHFIPLPYSVVTAVGVWRSAGRHGGQAKFANFARIGVLAWVCLWLAI
jgi:hypothetical protein